MNVGEVNKSTQFKKCLAKFNSDIKEKNVNAINSSGIFCMIEAWLRTKRALSKIVDGIKTILVDELMFSKEQLQLQSGKQESQSIAKSQNI